MQTKSNRLYFIDAMRAWAIIMMLQGHFVDGLLDPIYKVSGNLFYEIWRYFRGVTAPTFFTLSGFIFTFLMIRKPDMSYQKERAKKGLKRGLELIGIGYLLQTNFLGLLHGEIYNSFYIVNVLHCIGVSLILIIILYRLTEKFNINFGYTLLILSVLLFTFEPIYSNYTFNFLPWLFQNYFTKINGSVFTIAPWFGYAGFGAALAHFFKKYKDNPNFYSYTIPILSALGLWLIFFSSPFFLTLYQHTGIELFGLIKNNNYLFIRLGDVFIISVIFIALRNYIPKTSQFLTIGKNTLTVYIVHFIILYGSFTGLGLYRFFYHSWSPILVILGALGFIWVCSKISLLYVKFKPLIILKINQQITKLKIVDLSFLREVRLRFKKIILFLISKN